MNKCEIYCGIACINGLCPNADEDKQIKIKCTDCFYNEGCADCIYSKNGKQCSITMPSRESEAENE